MRQDRMSLRVTRTMLYTDTPRLARIHLPPSLRHSTYMYVCAYVYRPRYNTVVTAKVEMYMYVPTLVVHTYR